MPADNIAWALPRPKPDRYPGGFPLWFEEKLLKLYDYDYKNEDLKGRVLQLFAGKTKFGYRVDIREDVEPDLVHDCHDLPDHWTDSWEFVIADPPYSNELSARLYDTGPIKYKEYAAEAVRVTKVNGHTALYHFRSKPNPAPKKCRLVRRIMIDTRINHHLRICKIYRKTESW